MTQLHFLGLVLRFPKNKEQSWLELFGLTSNSVKIKLEFAELCSRHFNSDDFIVTKNGAQRLKTNIVPTIRFVDE